MGARGVTRFARPAWRPAVSLGLPVSLVTVTLAGLLPLAMQGGFFAAAAVGLAVGLCVFVAVGLERSAIASMALSFFLVPMDNVRPVAGSIVAFSDIFLVVALVLVIPLLIQRDFRIDAILLLGVGMVLAVILVGVATSPNFVEALALAPRLILGALVLPTVFMWWRPPISTVPLLAGAYVAGNVVSVVWGVIGGPRSLEGRSLGLSTHPNVLGLTALLASALALYLWTELPRWRWLTTPAGLICAWGVWDSGSRAALVVTVGIVGLYPLLTRSIEATLALTAVAGVGAFLVGRAISIGNDSTNALGRLLGQGSASASDQVRAEHAEKAAAEIAQNPYLGTGLSAATLDTHNIYLQVAQAGGLALLVAFLILLAAVVRRPFLIDPRFRLLALAGIAYVVVGPITPILWDRYIWSVLALPFLVPLDKETRQEDGAPWVVPARLRHLIRTSGRTGSRLNT